MRIISGIAKGKKIILPINKKTRPLKDMVRESIFNILKHSDLLKLELEKCNILDLFSGVGSFGLEAISRGAKKVVFFENYKPAVNLLSKNIDILSFKNKTEICNKNIYAVNCFKDLKNKFNIVFLDPPFKEKNINLILENLSNSKLFNSETLIIIHRHKKTLDSLDKTLKIKKEKIYGSSKILFGFFNYQEF
tara:strand:+ start:666 stop:1241 length:576 start_codon:yes stop_codon:yes gene_type:complete